MTHHVTYNYIDIPRASLRNLEHSARTSHNGTIVTMTLTYEGLTEVDVSGVTRLAPGLATFATIRDAERLVRQRLLEKHRPLVIKSESGTINAGDPDPDPDGGPTPLDARVQRVTDELLRVHFTVRVAIHEPRRSRRRRAADAALGWLLPIRITTVNIRNFAVAAMYRGLTLALRPLSKLASRFNPRDP